MRPRLVPGIGEPVIDLHCHLLAGIDDGPGTLDGSMAIARAAVAAGTRTIVATPHVSWRYENTSQVIADHVEQVTERLAAEGLELEVLAGAEIALTRIEGLEAHEIERLALAGGSWLLVEPPFTPAATGVDSSLLALQSEGRRILLAHPERCPAFHRDPDMLARIVRGGVLTSITAGSLVGRFGEQARRFAVGLLREGLAHMSPPTATTRSTGDRAWPGRSSRRASGRSPIG